MWRSVTLAAILELPITLAAIATAPSARPCPLLAGSTRAWRASCRDLGPRPTERRLGRRVGVARRRGPVARTLGLSRVPALAHAISIHAGHPAARGLDGHRSPDVPRALPRARPRKLGAAVVGRRGRVWCRARGRGNRPALREGASRDVQGLRSRLCRSSSERSSQTTTPPYARMRPKCGRPRRRPYPMARPSRRST